MSEVSIDYDVLSGSVTRFNDSLERLETSLQKAVHTVADLARSTGFEDGKAAALANIETSSGELILREELMASKARERELENAIKAARSALNETIDELKNIIGNVQVA